MTTSPIVALPTDPMSAGVNFTDIATNVGMAAAEQQSATFDPNAAFFTKKEPSVFESIGEAARQFNTEANLYEAIRKSLRDDPNRDPDFDAYEYAKANLERPEMRRALPEIFDRLHAIGSREAFDRVVEDVNLELNDSEKMTANGIIPMLLGGVVGTIASPSTWTAGGLATRAMRSLKIAQGASRAARASRFGAVSVAETIPLDVASRLSMETYDWIDSLENYGFSAAGGALIGRYLGTDIPGSKFAKDGEGWRNLDNAGQMTDVPANDSLSAARAIRGDRPADGGTLAPFDFATPTGRAARRGADGNDLDFGIHSALYETNVGTVGNEAGRATGASAELMSKVIFDARFYSMQQEVVDIYRRMALDVFGEGRIGGTVRDMLSREDGRISMQRFNELVEDYNRARMSLEEWATNAAPIIDNIHPNPKVAAAIKEAAEARVQFYKKFRQDLEDTGMLGREFVVVSKWEKPKSFKTAEEANAYVATKKTKNPEFEASVVENKPDSKEVYSAILLNRGAVHANPDKFRMLVRKALKGNPPTEFLVERFGKSSLKEMTPDEREMAIAEWVHAQRDGFEKAAEASYQKATKELGRLLNSKILTEKRAKEASKLKAKTELERARLVERELSNEAQMKRAARADAENELKALKAAWDLAQARNVQRAAQAPTTAPDVGAKELEALEKANARLPKVNAKAERTTLDALTDVLTPEGRAKDAGDVAKANAAVDRAATQQFDANLKAKVEPLEAPKAKEADFDTRKIGTLEERLKTANQRLTQLDREIEDVAERLVTIRDKRAKAEATLDALRETRKAIADAQRALRKELPKAMANTRRAVANLDKAYGGTYKTIEDYVDEVMERITKGKDIPRAILEETVGESGRVKSRELFVGDILNDPDLKEFIETDGNRIAELYAMDISPRIAFRRVFGNDVDDSLSRPLKDLNDYWQQKIEAEQDPAKREVYIKQQEESLRDFQGVRDRLLNRLGTPDEPNSFWQWLVRNLGRFNVARLMGLSLLANLSDAATGAFSTGKTFAWVPELGRNMSKFAAKIPSHEIRAMIHGSEIARMHDIANRQVMPEAAHWESYGGFGTGATRKISQTIDRWMDVAARGTMILSGTAGFTAKLNGTFSVVQMINMADEIPRYASLTAKQKQTWARLGIDEYMANKIAKQIEKHSLDIDGVRVPDIDNWTDRDAAMAYMTSLRRVQDTAVIKPGAGDLPLFMSEATGRMFLQFQSYAFAASNRYVRLAWQARDINAITSVGMMLGIATMGYVMREFAKGTNDKGETPMDRLEKNKTADWMYEAVSRSALPGIWSLGIDASRKLFQKPVQDALGVEIFGNNPSRLAAQGALTGLLGPSVGLLENIASAANAVAEGPTQGWDRALKAGERIIPFGNLLPLMMLHRASEEALR